MDVNMAQSSSKFQQGAVVPLQIKFSGGLNYAQSPTHIADNELARAFNIIYNSQTGTPETRTGTQCVTAAALPAPIRKIYYYEKSSVSKWLMAVSGEKLYYLDADHWEEIGTDIINGTTIIPSFLTFNTLLLIADGTTNLRKWDGSTLASLTDGLQATAIAEVGARVVINSASDPDLVTFSGVEDEAMWDTADLNNPAIGLRAGFGDNLWVNGFAVFNSDLIVSKRGDSNKYLYRINTAGVPTDWTVSRMSINNCAQNEHCLTSAFNNVYFIDTDGFKSIKGVQEYGDLQIDLTGAKVNTAFDLRTCFELSYIPMFTALWYLTSDRIYAYHKFREGEAFTEIWFAQGQINSVTQANSILYLAGANGYLYKMTGTEETDETAPNVEEDISTLLATKRFNFSGGGILRKLAVEFRPLDNVTANTPAYIRYVDEDGSKTLLKAISILLPVIEVYDATFDVYDANMEVGALAGYAWQERTTNRVRGSSIQFQIDATQGRFGIEGLQAEIAQVGS